MITSPKQQAIAYYHGLIDKPQYHYIVIDDLPEDQKEIFDAWIAGEFQPMPDDREDIDCAYYWDYEIWYDYAIKGEIAPKN